MRTIILGGLLALSTVAAQAAVYKWVDQNGKTHYSDRPVQNAEPVKAPGKSGAPPAQSPDKPKEDAAATPKTAPPKDESAAVLKARTQKCEQARKRVEEYQDATGLYTKDEFGEQRVLTPEEQVQAIVDMQKNVDAYCEGLPEPEPAEQPEQAEAAP